MEIEAINSKANAGLTTGIIGTAGLALSLLSHGFTGMGNNSVTPAVTSGLCAAIPSALENAVGRHELDHRLEDIQTISEKDAEISELKMNTLMDSKVLDLYKYVENKFHDQDQKFADQGVWNATATGSMSSMAAQIANLQTVCAQITKTVVPNTAVCPGWGNVTITPATTTTASA